MTSGAPSDRIRVLVMASYPTLRAGLRSVLEGDPIFEVAGEASGTDDLTLQIERIVPQVVLIDAGGEPDTILDTLGALVAGQTPLPVVLMTPAIESVAEVLELGIQGFLLPDATADEIGAALRSVVAGLTVVDGRAAARLLERRDVPGAPPLEDATVEALTPREREVLELIARGFPNKTIALELGISEHTVKFHVGSILTKLGASSRAEALARAARLGLITL